MLIVDMPMPKGCTWTDENENGHLCPLLDIDCDCVLQEKGRKIGWAEQYAKCPIKGELVRCGECRWWSKDEPDDEYGYCYNGKIIGSTKENWYCADGKRKDGEHGEQAYASQKSR